MPAPTSSPFASLREPPLSEVERRVFEAETARLGEPRVGLLYLLLAVISVIAAPAYLRRLGQPPVNHAEVVLLCLLLGTIGAVSFLTVIALRRARRQPPSQNAVELGALGIMVFAAVISLNGSRVSGGMTAWPAATLLLAVLLRLRGLAALTLFIGGGLGVALAVLWLHGFSGVGLTWFVTAAALALISWASHRSLSVSLATDVHQRQVIADQQETLAQLNRSLESRVEAQVGEILERAAEIEKLNEHLRQQVKDRTEALRRALADVARSETVLDAGVLFEDRIEISFRLSKGGMGTVYRGFDKVLGRPVALKLLSTGGNDPAAVRRFLDEATAAANIRHPGVVVPLHVDVTKNGEIYQVLELVEGIELSHLSLPIPVSAVARIGAQLAEALAVAHAAGVVHRDIKAANVMLTRTAPGLRLLDFGVARLLGTASSTATGQVVGTPLSMAPEQIEAPDTASNPVDLYALGILLFELASGRSPFARESLTLTLIAHLKDDPPPLEVHPVLDALVLRCLAKKPDDRPSATDCMLQLAELADALHAPPAWQLELVEERKLDDMLGDTQSLRAPSGAVAPP